MRTVVLITTTLMLAGCGIAGKLPFLEQAPHRTGDFPKGYQALFKCFSENAFYRPDGLRSAVLPDLGRAETLLVQGDEWWYLAEFVRIGDQETRVDIRHINESVVEKDWAAVEACARG